MATGIPGLHDIHLPASPAWWPPAPGWWILAIVCVLAMGWLAWRVLGSRRRRCRIAAALGAYDAAIAHAATDPARIAAASSLLRRAAKVNEPALAQLHGDAWLRFLDGDDPARSFSSGAGSLLQDGGFRRSVDGDVAAALALARSRFGALIEQATGAQAHA